VSPFQKEGVELYLLFSFISLPLVVPCLYHTRQQPSVQLVYHSNKTGLIQKEIRDDSKATVIVPLTIFQKNTYILSTTDEHGMQSSLLSFTPKVIDVCNTPLVN